MAPTQLILGEDVTNMSDEYIETVGNEELIAVNQVSYFKSKNPVILSHRLFLKQHHVSK